MAISYWLPNITTMLNKYLTYVQIYCPKDLFGTLLITLHPPSYNIKRISYKNMS